MSTADLADDGPDVWRDGAGRPYLEGEGLPDLPAVLAHAHRLPGVAAVVATDRPAARGAWGEWVLEFEFRGRPFVVHTNDNGGVTVYSSPDPACSAPLLLEVVGLFEGQVRPLPGWVPPPPLDARRLAWLALLALAVAAPLAVFLSLCRKP